MYYHLNYDHKNENGIIFNDKYPTGVMYEGKEFKPKLSFEYDSFIYSERSHTQYDYLKDGVKRDLSEDEKAEIRALSVEWTQPIGQQGNPSKEQRHSNVLFICGTMLQRTNTILSVDMINNTTAKEKDLVVEYRQTLLDGIKYPESYTIPRREELNKELIYVFNRFGISYNLKKTATCMTI